MSVWGSQFKVGDQNEEIRRAFWGTLCKKCPKCEKMNVKEEKHTAGCRMNGDAYGTNVFTCQDCNWQTSFQWDEQSDNYWYETLGWKILDEYKSK
jgi:RNase P subunit RPR2